MYRRILHQFTQWVEKRVGQAHRFSPEQITTLLVEQYLEDLERLAYSPSHCTRAKSVISQFCQRVVEEKGILRHNPARGVTAETPQPRTPRMLTPTQRSIFLNLVKQEDRRGKALFALGYFVGCRVTDIVELQIGDLHVGPKSGWLHLGGESARARDIDLSNEARLLYDYLQHRERDEGRLIAPITFHDLRHDFAHRALEAG